MSTDLRLGRYQEALADVAEVDAVIVDAPYSARTHTNHARLRTADGSLRKADIAYAGWTPDDVRECVDFFAPRNRGWWVTITDHSLAVSWAECLADAGLYVFAPLPWVARGSRVRLAGDGPSSWTCWIVVARPRVAPFTKWGTLPGAYDFVTDSRGSGRSIVMGQKPIALMRALVRDYTRPGDLVCDPCAGGGTTLRAAQLEGRRGVGSEMDPDTYAKAAERLAQPFSAPLFYEEQPKQPTIEFDNGQ